MDWTGTGRELGSESDRAASAGYAGATGARQEGSLLFSLGQLGAAPPAADAGGSGLLDLRALAGTLAAAPRERSSRAPDLFARASLAPPLGPVLAPPALPAPPASGSSWRRLVAALVAGSAVFGLSCALCAWAAASPPRSQARPIAVPQAPELPASSAEGQQAGAVVPAAPAILVAVAPRDGTDAPGSAVDAAPAAAPAAPVDEAGSPHRAAAPRARTSRGHRAPQQAEAIPVAATPARAGLDVLIDEVLVSEDRAPRRPAVDPARPRTPSRTDVVRAMESVRGAVAACGGGQHGDAIVDLAVDGATGRVSTARVSGPLAGTPAGSCIARAVRGASFPTFANPRFAVRYPFRI